MSSNRRGRPRTLSARLIAGQLALLALVCLVIGGTTLLLVQALLVNRRDRQWAGASQRASNAGHDRDHGPFGPTGPNGPVGPNGPGCQLGGQLPPGLNAPGLPPGTIAALFCQDGRVMGGRLRPNTADQ